MLRIVPPGIEPVERDALIGADARRFVDGMGINAVILHVAFGARDEESSSLMQRTQPSKINIAAIHHVNGPSFRHDQIQRQRIAHFTVRNVDEAGNGATQIKQRMQLDRRLGRTKMGPRKQRKAQIDCRAVERVNCIGQIKPDVIMNIECARAAD